MKYFLPFASLLLLPVIGFSQILTANAGADSVLCNTNILNETIIVGGSESASGGSGNYSYTWDIYPKPYIPFPGAPQNKVWASDMLSDTTAANPSILPAIPGDSDGPVRFILRVMDDSGSIALDTAEFFWTTWIQTPGSQMFNSFPGDTQSITPNGFAGGFPPYTIDWGTSPILIGNQFDMNVPASGLPNLTRDIVIPNGPSPYWYPILITDSVGCTLSNGSYEGFFIFPLSVSEVDAEGVKIIRTDVGFRLESEKRFEKIMAFGLSGQEIPINVESTSNGYSVSTSFRGVLIVNAFSGEEATRFKMEL